MKLTILVPSELYKSSAGARIRYRRLGSHLGDAGVELSLEEVRGFDSVNADCDVLLVSKCYDARALVAAAALSSRGKLVGVDLFDDYFSAAEDSRLLRHRSWLAQIVGFCDFALCSTRKMAEVVEQYDSGLPVHVLNDPAPHFDPDAIGSAVAMKVARARSTGIIRIGWFGVGDNPYFSVGLSDLSAHAAMLTELAETGLQVELTILTNRRSLTADGLSLIEQLPVRNQVVEWSEFAEREFLGEMLAVFLPVSAAAFSMAKSLNRAVSALTSACQVLSAGYPLYSALEPFLYRSPAKLVYDFDRGSLRLSGDTIDSFREIIAHVASAENEARRLVRFLSDLKLRPLERSLPLALVHGHSTHPDSHRLVQDAKGFSIASPYCTAALDFDIIFRGTAGGLRMLVSRKAAERLLQPMQARLRRFEAGGAKGYLHLAGNEDSSAAKDADLANWANAGVPFQLATYRKAMSDIKRQMTEAFGDCRTVLSERSPLPFPAISWGADADDG